MVGGGRRQDAREPMGCRGRNISRFPRVLDSMMHVRVATSIVRRGSVPGPRARFAYPIDPVARHLIFRPFACPPFPRTMTMMQQPGPEAAHRLLDFVNASPTPFHAVAAAAARLEKAGFLKVQRRWCRSSHTVIAHDGPR